MNTLELQEQIQQDLLAFLDGQPQELLNEVCNIVVRNFKKLDAPVGDSVSINIDAKSSTTALYAQIICTIQDTIIDMESETGKSCISTEELEAASSPCLVSDGDYTRLAEVFYEKGAEVVSYIGSQETKSEFVSYEDMSLEVLIQIKELVSSWTEFF